MDRCEWSLRVSINNTNNKFISWWNDDERRDRWHCGTRSYIFQMALIPRWSLMTEESKNLVKNVVISSIVLLIGFALIRALFGYIVIAIIAWFAWNMLKRKWLPCKEYKDYAKNTRWLTVKKKKAEILKLPLRKDQRWYQVWHIRLDCNFDRLIVSQTEAAAINIKNRNYCPIKNTNEDEALQIWTVTNNKSRADESFCRTQASSLTTKIICDQTNTPR